MYVHGFKPKFPTNNSVPACGAVKAERINIHCFINFAKNPSRLGFYNQIQDWSNPEDAYSVPNPIF